ncbi:hypothetical protein B0H19DRAFT_1368609 [Mycena capillaripes]|nr:hypothetical protein B0H19DRAFT_1368609 [Mycena capillaripes]
MNHPYSSAASIRIYSNETRRPLPQPNVAAVPNQRNPLPPLPLKPPPKSRDGNWVTESTHKLYVPPDASATVEPAPAYTQLEPLRPNRSPAHRYQQQPHPAAPEPPGSGWIEVEHPHSHSQSSLLRPNRAPAQRHQQHEPPSSRWDNYARPRTHSHSEPLRSLRAPIGNLFQKQKQKQIPAPESSGWVDESDDESDASPRGPASLASNETAVSAPQPPLELEFKSSRPRPAPVPYEMRPSERALAARKHAAWRKKIMDIMLI